jgi:hypothetical protein
VTWQLTSILPVWAIAIIGAVLIGVISAPEDYLSWLPIVFAATIISAFVIQLAIRRKDGFVVRVMASTGGALVILGVATAVLLAV